MFEYLMLGDVRAQKYSKTGARTYSILEKFVFDAALPFFDLYELFFVKRFFFLFFVKKVSQDFFNAK